MSSHVLSFFFLLLILYNTSLHGLEAHNTYDDKAEQSLLFCGWFIYSTRTINCSSYWVTKYVSTTQAAGISIIVIISTIAFLETKDYEEREITTSL